MKPSKAEDYFALKDKLSQRLALKFRLVQV